MNLERRRRRIGWFVPDMTGPELLSQLTARLADPQTGALRSAAGWASDVATATDLGLVAVSGPKDDPALTRTEFGDLWVAQREQSGQSVPLLEMVWPNGPGRFGLLFFPLTRRPLFPVLAMAGPAVSEIRRGGWNLEHGFGGLGANPVTDVEMWNTLVDGRNVCVQSGTLSRVGFPALQVAASSAYLAAADTLMAALLAGDDPWLPRIVQVDGLPVQAFVLNLHSAALPAGVIDLPCWLSSRLARRK